MDGKIANPIELVKKLQAIKENFDLPFVFFTLPDDLTYLFTVTIPVNFGQNASESVAFTIEENVPLSLSETVYDYLPVKRNHTDSGFSAEIVVAACVKKEMDKFIDALNQSGLEPVGAIHESQAIADAIIPKDAEGTFCIIYSRALKVEIILVKNRVVHFSTIRVISEGDYKNQFLDEYEKFVEYSIKYGNKDEDQIAGVYVCGEFEYTKKVIDAISNAVTSVKNAKLSNVWVNVLKIDKEIPSVNFEDSLNLASSVGAVIADIM